MENKDSKVANSSNITEFMTFELGAMKYAIELQKSKKYWLILIILLLYQILKTGLKVWLIPRGEVVPILDIRIKFHRKIVYNRKQHHYSYVRR